MVITPWPVVAAAGLAALIVLHFVWRRRQLKRALEARGNGTGGSSLTPIITISSEVPKDSFTNFVQRKKGVALRSKKDIVVL